MDSEPPEQFPEALIFGISVRYIGPEFKPESPFALTSVTEPISSDRRSKGSQ